MQLHRAALPALLLASLMACRPSGGVEGKYYNEAGNFVMELDDGKVAMAPGMEQLNATYEVRGDSIVLKDPAGSAELTVLVRQKDGTINAGMLGTLKKR